MLKYICLSDLHAGAPTSLLMPPPTTFSAVLEPVTKAFGDALEHFLSAADATPQLILLGDVLELQFANRAHAYHNALGFLDRIQNTGRLQGEVIATAGNHDHALWTDARLAMETDTLSLSPDDFTYRQSTPAFSPTKGAQSRLLDKLLTKAGFDSVDLRYPNIGFANDHRAVMLHHGHFVEPAYKLMTTLRETFTKPPYPTMSAELIASENAGWLDFFWSSTGDAGLGQYASDLYQNGLTTTGFRNLSAGLTKVITDELRDIMPLAGNMTARQIIHNATRVGIDVTLGRARDTERFAEVEALTTGGYDGVRWYINAVLKDQLKAELNGIFADLTFVFGHTHKPFAERIATDGFALPVKTYNTGGWTLNGPRLDNAEGAGMVLIDDKLNVAMVKLFSTPHHDEVARASVEMLCDGPEAATFREEINSWLNAPGNPWDALAAAAGEAYVKRQNYILDLTAHKKVAQ